MALRSLKTSRHLLDLSLAIARPLVIGAIHLKALPGTPLFQLPIEEITNFALKEAREYINCGVDALIIENTNDLPYTLRKDLDPVIVASMATISHSIRQAHSTIPIGVQVLAGANIEALAVAKSSQLDFIRAEGFVFGHVADEGWMNACAGPLMRYRKSIDASGVLVLADIKKKHSSHAITADVSLSETAEAAEFFNADGVVITGTSTGVKTNPDDLKAIKTSSCKLPVFIGSGVTKENWKLYKDATGFIVGSYFKKDGHWHSDLDSEKIKDFMADVRNEFS